MTKIGDLGTVNGFLDRTTLAADDLIVLQRADGSTALIRADEARTKYAPVGPLARFKTDANSASTTPVRIFGPGDSLAAGLEGTGGSSTNFLNERWPARLMGLLRTRHGVSPGPGGLGYVNILNNEHNGSGAGDAYWTYDATGATIDTNNANAFGHTTITLAANKVITLVYLGTSAKLHYDLGSSAFSYTVDGGGSTTITPAAGSGMKGWTALPVISHGTHTVVITPTSGQIAKVRGAFIYDGDETSGFHYYDNAESGLLGILDSTYAETQKCAAGGCVDPSLVILPFATNDYGASIATATFISSMEDEIQKWNPTNGLVTRWPTILLVAPHERGDDNPGVTSPSWAQYITAFNTIAASEPDHVTFLDMSALMARPTAGNSYSGGKVNSSDLVHLTYGGSGGHAFWASSIDAALAA